MQPAEFIYNFREAFGGQAGLPVAFWYSDAPVRKPETTDGCFFKRFHKIRNGTPASFDRDSITCGGGRLYTGFGEMAERIPRFVSLTERYKQTPESVLQYVEDLKIVRRDGEYLNFTRVDNLDDFSLVEGVLFFAAPDVLSGLLAWAWFDNHEPDAVASMFGSGCGQTITMTVKENRGNGRRAFLGGFDPSVRPYLRRDELTFSIPMGRFREMLSVMRDTCLYGTNAWGKIKKRITTK